MKTSSLASKFGFVLATFALALAPIQPLRASLAGEVVERLAKASGRIVGKAGKAAAREALEKAAVKYGDEAIELAERGGFGLPEAGAKFGDDVWRLAKLAPGAPRALAARAETLVPLARRFGDDAMLVELKAPGCGEILATAVKPENLRHIAEKAGEQEVKRFAALAKHCSPEEVDLAVKAWRKRGPKILELLTPRRIAAAGGVATLLYGASKLPEITENLPDKLPIPWPDLSEPLNRLLQGLCLVGGLAVLFLLRKPLAWLARISYRTATLLGRILRAPSAGPRLEARMDRNISRKLPESSPSNYFLETWKQTTNANETRRPPRHRHEPRNSQHNENRTVRLPQPDTAEPRAAFPAHPPSIDEKRKTLAKRPAPQAKPAPLERVFSPGGGEGCICQVADYPENVVGHVALCRSRTTGALFGIRFRKEGRKWVADYAFPLKPGQEKREGFGEAVSLRGLLDHDPNYQGCPDNGDESFFKCNCGRLTNWTEEMVDFAVCRWCGYEGPCLMGAHDLHTCGEL